MNKVKGNYLWWAGVHIFAGILIAVLTIYTRMNFVYVLLSAIFPLAAFVSWFDKTHKPDERETVILLKVYASAGFVALVIVSGFHESFSNNIVPALWSSFLTSRGLFGFIYFLKD